MTASAQQPACAGGPSVRSGKFFASARRSRRDAINGRGYDGEPAHPAKPIMQGGYRDARLPFRCAGR